MHFRIFETWRLTAALLVMIWHFLRFAPPGAEAVSSGLYRLMPMMEMFLMISGFLIMFRYEPTLMRQKGSLWAFYVTRVARFYPLYLVTLLFFVIVGIAVHSGLVPSNDHGRYAWDMLIPNILLIQAWGVQDQLTFNYVAWTLSAEWFCYLVFPAIVLAYRYGSYIGLLVVAVLSMILMEIGTATGIIPFDSWFHADSWGAYRAFADFCLGALIAMLARNATWTMKSHVPAWFVFSASIVAMMMEANNYLVLFLLGLAMLLAAVAERDNPDGSKFLARLHPVGQVSFGIYLIHPVMETIFFALLWRKVIEPTGISFYVWWFVPMAATIITAMLSARFYEGPVGKRLREKLIVKPTGKSAMAMQPAE